ncbi:MAG: hypothetical protein M0042_03535 [Nitrospiraceae bacterium]|nr:hypothetical protein [Nitrospiraceae bacterium]
MKIATYILIGLLVIVLAGGAYFYLSVYQPAAADLAKYEAAKPEQEKLKRTLSKYQEKEKQTSAWIAPAVETLKKGLAKEIADGTAEVVAVDNRVVVNIAEQVLFTPQSVTFAKESPQALANLAAVLKELKGMDISVGNSTEGAPAKGRGRKRVPAKDARSLASGRMVELVKYLVTKGGVAEESLIASSYAAKMPDQGFKIKNHKVILVVSPRSNTAAAEAPAAKAETKPAAATKPVGTAAATASAPAPAATAPVPAPSTPKPIPITRPAVTKVP